MVQLKKADVFGDSSNMHDTKTGNVIAGCFGCLFDCFLVMEHERLFFFEAQSTNDFET